VRNKNWPAVGDHGPKTKDGIEQQPSSSEIAKAKQGGNSELRFHPLANIFPLMEGAEFDALIADIKAHGPLERIVLYEGKILDGRNRYRALRAAGVDPTTIRDKFTVDGMVGDDPAAYVISANIHRRHLDADDRQKFLIQVIAAAPEKSDRTLAKETGFTHPTIAKARKQGEATGKVFPVEKRAGADGKARKSPWSRERYKKLRARRRGQPARKAQFAAMDENDDAERPEWGRAIDATGNKFLSELLEFNSDFTNRYRNWLATADIDSHTRQVLNEAIHRCANNLSMMAQETVEIVEEPAELPPDNDGDIPGPDCVVRAARAGAS
jgi:ParB-like chromosome segregation protein Spo0J